MYQGHKIGEVHKLFASVILQSVCSKCEGNFKSNPFNILTGI